MIDWFYHMSARVAQTVLPSPLWRVPDAGNTLYLTFDDGPTPNGTPILQSLLARYDAKATFFLLGRQARRFPAAVDGLVRDGHGIGNHSYNHIDPWRSSAARLMQELSQTNDLLSERTGRTIRMARPPYGRVRPAFARWCAEHQCRVVLWDVLSGDFRRSATPSRVASNVITRVRSGSIVVLHDHPLFLDVMLPALETILTHLGASGWRFEALPESPAPVDH